MKAILLIAVATLCFGATESRVPRRQILDVEGSINNKFRSNFADPYDLLGDARGTYLDSYGALFTMELELITVAPPSPFKPTISPAEIQTIHDRKLKKLTDLRQAMYGLMAELPPSSTVCRRPNTSLWKRFSGITAGRIRATFPNACS